MGINSYAGVSQVRLELESDVLEGGNHVGPCPGILRGRVVEIRARSNARPVVVRGGRISVRTLARQSAGALDSRCSAVLRPPRSRDHCSHY